jgi:hypothetical protein
MKKNSRKYLPMIFGAISLCVNADNGYIGILQEIAKDAKDAKNYSEQEGRKLFHCPKEVQKLRGITKQEIVSILGEPQFSEEFPQKEFEEIFYKIEWQHHEKQLGGGFPELKFTLGKDHVVKEVNCYYAR